MKVYDSFEEIDEELTRLALKRKIAMEQVKGLALQSKQEIQSFGWLGPVYAIAKKVGTMMLFKKLFR